MKDDDDEIVERRSRGVIFKDKVFDDNATKTVETGDEIAKCWDRECGG